MTGQRVRKLALAGAWWLLPVIFLFWLYRDGLSAWFLADDFAWLSLLQKVHGPRDLIHQLFLPEAQGTIRPWSERGFFIALQAMFGFDSLPFRIVAFATAAVDLFLIAWVTRRMTGSRVAGFLAPVLWAVNSALVRVMTWNSAYNELMCPLFLLAALALLIRFAETARTRYWWWQLVVFSLGFGALEINIVYPAIAAAWIVFAAPREQRNFLLRSVIPLAGVSVIYFIVHRIAVSLPASGEYTMHFDGSTLKTLAVYWKWALVPRNFELYGYRHKTTLRILWLLTLAVAGYVCREIACSRLKVCFFLAWFLLTIAPVLPFTQHLTDYYLTIPFIGIAMLGAAAAAQYWCGSWTTRVLMAAPVCVYFLVMVSISQQATAWWVGQSLSVRTLVLGVMAAEKTHPGKGIAVDGVTTQLFDMALADYPFIPDGFYDFYLTPGSELKIKAAPGAPDVAPMVLESAAMWHAITHDQVVVYSLESNHLRNITERYARSMVDRSVDRLPTRVDVGKSLYSWLLGPGWLPAESGFRWMPGSATIRLGVPPEGGTQLELEGYCPEAQLLPGPRHLMVLVDGVLAGDTRIYDPESDFNRLLPMPAALAGKTAVNIEIRVDPVDRSNGREYGLIFGKIAIRP